MDNLICSVCQNSSFYEDNQGSLVCSVCGVLSQEFIAIAEEDQIDDEGGEARKKDMKILRTRTKNIKTKLKILREPSLQDFLEAYQFCLKLLIRRIPDVSESFENRVFKIWVNALCS